MSDNFPQKASSLVAADCHPIWKCPRCHGNLTVSLENLTCLSCASDYPIIEGIPDLREIDRVAAPNACAAFATPNRFSLTTEPHVYIWGVGWIPRPWQKAYVKLRKGISYDFTRLLSVREARKLFRLHTRFQIKILIPQVSIEELARYSKLRRFVALTYNALATWIILAPVFRFIGPFFWVIGHKTRL